MVGRAAELDCRATKALVGWSGAKLGKQGNGEVCLRHANLLGLDVQAKIDGVP